MVRDELCEVLRSLVGRWRCRVVARRPRERTIEMVFGEREEHRRRPEELLRLRPGLEGRGVITRVATRLQLVDPVPARGDREARIAQDAPVEPALVEVVIVEGAEIRQEPPERPDEPELSGDEVDDEAELRLPRELEGPLGLSLHLVERISLPFSCTPARSLHFTSDSVARRWLVCQWRREADAGQWRREADTGARRGVEP